MSTVAPERPASITTPPKFTADQFAGDGYKSGTAAHKARFANALTRFIAAGFPKAKFTRALYNDLHLHFEHIAHYDLDGFYYAQFSNSAKQAAFLNHLILTCDRARPDDAFLWGDVQAALVADQNRAWLACQLDRI